MNRSTALEASRREFERRLALVGADDWDRPTPCDAWTVRELVNHVIGGCTRYTMLLHGATPAQTDATRTHDHVGPDAAASFAAAADEMVAAFGEPGALTLTVHHPAGDRSGAALLDMRIMDFAIHAWDLARAVGSDETLDPALVAVVADIVSELGPELVAKGYFAAGPPAPRSDQTPQDRLLRLAGRAPR